MKLEGIFPALTTPFDGETISLDALRHNLERYESVGLGGYLVLGSTAETVLLDEKERSRLLETARASLPGDRPLVAGLSAEATRDALRQARTAASCGADVVLLSTPHYYRSEMTPQVLKAHFVAVADASPLPVLLYNVPKFTGVVIPEEVVLEVGAHDNVAGMKESSGDLEYVRRILAGAPPGFRLLCGATSILRPALDAGACGAILAAATIFPEPLMRIAADPAFPPDRLRALAEACDRVAGRHGIAGIKRAMDLRGLHGGPVRSPLLPLTEPVVREIERAIDALVEDDLLPARRL